MQKINYFDDLTLYAVSQKVLLTPLRYSVTLVDNWYSFGFIRTGHVLFRRNKEINKLNGPVIFWERPGPEYQFLKEKNDIQPYEHLWVDCGGSRAKRMVESLEKSFPKGFVELPSMEQGTSFFLSMLKDFRSNAKLYHGRVVLTLEQLVWYLIQLQNPIQPEDFDEGSISRIAEAIRINPFQKFDFRKIAESLSISYNHFRRLFRKAMDSPLYDYVLEQRMLQAAHLLASKRLRIKEVADSCGFDDLSSFSRSFRKRYGVSPREWIRKSKDRINQRSTEMDEQGYIELASEKKTVVLDPDVCNWSFSFQQDKLFVKGESEKKQ